jgi:hypothetical protein
MSSLINALRVEHVNACNNNTCDICAAYQEDQFLWAAHLLVRGNSFPKTEEALNERRPSKLALEMERLTTLFSLPRVQCASCSSTVWGTAAYCGNCGEKVESGTKEPDKELRSQVTSLMLDVGLEVGAIGVNEEDMYAVMLEDLMCYCEVHGGSFEEALKRAREKFEARTRQEAKGKKEEKTGG